MHGQIKILILFFNLTLIYSAKNAERTEYSAYNKQLTEHLGTKDLALQKSGPQYKRPTCIWG